MPGSQSEWISKKVQLVVAEKFGFDRLDHYLVRQQVHPSRSFLQKLIKDGDIRVNGKTTKANTKIRPGDIVTCSIPSPKPLDLFIRTKEWPAPEMWFRGWITDEQSSKEPFGPDGRWNMMNPGPADFSGTEVIPFVNLKLYKAIGKF